MSLNSSPDFLLESSEPDTNGNNSHSYRFGSFHLNAAERQLFNAEVLVPLTPRAFDLLLLFMERAGHLVSKDDILHLVWNDAFVEEANIARVVHTLRQALGEDQNGDRFIETVPKKGYRFVAKVERYDSLSEVAPDSAWANGAQSVRRRVLVPVALLTVAALTVLFVVLNRGWMFSSERETIDSIAVLPFENGTQEVDLDYLADGITENVINTLARIPELRVSPRSSVFKYKNSAEDSETIGQALRVRAVVTGRIVRRGDSFFIQTELTDVDRKAQIWGHQYVQNASNLFGSQNEIARDLVSNLRLKLNDTQEQKLDKSLTENPDAQKAFLNGLYLYNQSTQQSQNVQIAAEVRRSYCEKSVAYFQEAIKFEPNYSQAYANMARAYRCLAVGQFSDFHERARESALAAIKLDETNDMAHRVLATLLRQQDWNWAESEREYKRAIELNPSESADARQGYAQLLSAQGRHEEAIHQIEFVEKHFPEMMVDHAWVGFIYKDARKYDLAMEKLRRIKEIRPENTWARFGLAEIYALKGMKDEAVTEAREIVGLMNGAPGSRMFLAGILAMVGRRNESVEILKEYERDAEKQSYPLSIHFASTYLQLDNKDRAFFWFEKAYEERSTSLVAGIKVSPAWDKLRDDPRYFDLLRRVDLD